MAVYVDDMYLQPLNRYGRMNRSHMTADNDLELHEMARKIGVDLNWYQGDHYNICLSKRWAALEHGAIPITMREMAVRVRRKKIARANRVLERSMNERRPKWADYLY